jgi:hypothetical protein
MHIAYNANTKSVGMKSNGKFMLKVLIWTLQFKQERQKKMTKCKEGLDKN